MNAPGDRAPAGHAALRPVIDALRAGHPVIIPTDTVLGVAADAANPAAVERLFALKNRPRSAPVPLLVPDLDAARRCASSWPAAADTLSRAFWPGALTLVVPKAGWIDEVVVGGRADVGLRQPDHPVALEILRLFGGPLACTSANPSGAPPAVTPDQLASPLRGIPLAPSGPCPGGAASTVVSLTPGSTLEIIREGPITPEELNRALTAEPGNPPEG